MGWEKDLPPGQELVACFGTFIAHLAPKTIRRHVDNLWRLGRRIITDLNETPKLRKQPVREVPWKAIDDDEGEPLINGGMDEQDQRSFDATCRSLRRGLSEAVRPRGAGPNGEEHGVARMGCFRRSGGFSVPLFST